jgi:SAM-dependent methyltransferase
MENEKMRTIDETGKHYNEIIFEDDYIPKNVYIHQIGLRNRLIDRLLAGKKFKHVVDIGSGTGFHLHTLGKYADNLIATDISMSALKESKKHNNCQFVVCDVNKLPFKPGTIDLIWIAGVLHHVPKDLDNVISNNLAPALKKDGIILIDEPNKLNFLNYLNMKLSKADPTGDERPLSLKHIITIFEKNNFITIEAEPYELFGPISGLINLAIVAKICHMLDKFISHTFLKIICIRWYIYAIKNK